MRNRFLANETSLFSIKICNSLLDIPSTLTFYVQPQVQYLQRLHCSESEFNRLIASRLETKNLVSFKKVEGIYCNNSNEFFVKNDQLVAVDLSDSLVTEIFLFQPLEMPLLLIEHAKSMTKLVEKINAFASDLLFQALFLYRALSLYKSTVENLLVTSLPGVSAFFEIIPLNNLTHCDIVQPMVVFRCIPPLLIPPNQSNSDKGAAWAKFEPLLNAFNLVCSPLFLFTM